LEMSWVLVDESGVVAHCISRLFPSPSSYHQVGLVIGHPCAEDQLVGLIPTPFPEAVDDPPQPPQERPTSATAGNSKQPLSPVETLDPEWTSEHAKQVYRMLPGGLKIMGAYLFADTRALSAMLPTMHRFLHSIREAAGYHQKDGPSELILLLIASDTKTYTAKRIDITNKKGNTRPAELVFQTFASSFHCFVSSVNISFSVPLAQGQSLGHQIKEALDLEAKELRNGVVLVNGTRVDEDALIGPDTGKRDKKSGKSKSNSKALTGNAVHKVEIFTEGLPSSLKGARSSKGSIGVFSYTGTIHCRAYCHPKDSYGTAIAAIKDDICKTLAVRLDFLCEELERQQGDRDKTKMATHFNPFGDYKRPPILEQRWGLPQRVFFPFVGQIHLSDYLMPFETIQTDCIERVKALLDLKVSEKDLISPERFSADGLGVELSPLPAGSRQGEAKGKRKTKPVKAEEEIISPRLATQQAEKEGSNRSVAFFGVAIGLLVALVALLVSLGLV